MKTAFRAALLFLVSIWLSHSLLPFLTPGAIAFGLAPLAVISLGLLQGPRAGAIGGFLAGAVESLLTGMPLGCASLSFTVVGWMAGRGAQRLNLGAAPALWGLIAGLLLLEQWIAIAAGWLVFETTAGVGWLDWMATTLLAPAGLWLARFTLQFPRMNAPSWMEQHAEE